MKVRSSTKTKKSARLFERSLHCIPGVQGLQVAFSVVVVSVLMYCKEQQWQSRARPCYQFTSSLARSTSLGRRCCPLTDTTRASYG